MSSWQELAAAISGVKAVIPHTSTFGDIALFSDTDNKAQSGRQTVFPSGFYKDSFNGAAAISASIKIRFSALSSQQIIFFANTAATTAQTAMALYLTSGNLLTLEARDASGATLRSIAQSVQTVAINTTYTIDWYVDIANDTGRARINKSSAMSGSMLFAGTTYVHATNPHVSYVGGQGGSSTHTAVNPVLGAWQGFAIGAGVWSDATFDSLADATLLLPDYYAAGYAQGLADAPAGGNSGGLTSITLSAI